MGMKLAIPERIAAFDVETPNYNNNRMSAIGIAVIERGVVTATYSSLVDPETYFDRFNIALTGITPEMAKAAPAFPDIWEEIAPVMEGSLLIAHNAPFDMRVLSLCLEHYGIDSKRYFPYACTVRMGKKCYPGLCDHRLDTLCGHLGVPLDHHRADSDSLACAKLLLDYLDRGVNLNDFIRIYDSYELRTKAPGSLEE
jgi:DNA polymerase III epsilon subunit-like protein